MLFLNFQTLLFCITFNINFRNTTDSFIGYRSNRLFTFLFYYNTVLKKAVKAMTDSGLRTVDYASGWSNRVDVAARRALMTGFNQVVAKVTRTTPNSSARNVSRSAITVVQDRHIRCGRAECTAKRSLKPSVDWVRSQVFAVRIAITAIRHSSRALKPRHTAKKNLTV